MMVDTDAEPPLMAAELLPAYETDGVSGEIAKRGMHCSSYPADFCFFCAYERNTNASSNEVDLYGSLADLATHLADLGREPASIAKHLHAQYESGVRMHIADKPAWKLESIIRHLLYNSGTTTGVFDTAISNMFTSLIARQNATLIDKTTNMVVEDHRKAFVDTVAQYTRWKMFTEKKRNGPKVNK